MYRKSSRIKCFEKTAPQSCGVLFFGAGAALPLKKNLKAHFSSYLFFYPRSA